MAAIRYVERNPVRAGLVKKAWEWEWSSAAFHTGRSDMELNLEDIKGILDIDVTKWEQYLNSEEIENQINIIRRNTKQGRPIGTSEFIEEIGAKVGRVLKTLPRGRPKKKKPLRARRIVAVPIKKVLLFYAKGIRIVLNIIIRHSKGHSIRKDGAQSQNLRA